MITNTYHLMKKIIQTEIENRCNKVDLARNLGKECGSCFKKREIYEEKTCKLKDSSPSACNKCPKITNCHLDKYFYYATKANQEYLNELVDSRIGINITPAEKKQVGEIMVPLLKQRQSVYQILSSCSEIQQREKTIYNYVNKGESLKKKVLMYFHLKNKYLENNLKINKYKKRKNIANYDGRKYEDYLKFN